MLIPSIDLQNGHVVQLVQGEKLAIEAPDPEPWIAKFSRFPRVQLIDLDAARGRGDNAAMVPAICGRLPCRVGGGIRSVERAREVLAAGAHAVIASSALFRDGAVDVGVRAVAGRRGRRRTRHRRRGQPRRPRRRFTAGRPSCRSPPSMPCGRSSRTARSSSTPTWTRKG